MLTVTEETVEFSSPTCHEMTGLAQKNLRCDGESEEDRFAALATTSYPQHLIHRQLDPRNQKGENNQR
jgi:hypothetical protein